MLTFPVIVDGLYLTVKHISVNFVENHRSQCSVLNGLVKDHPRLGLHELNITYKK